MRGRLSAFELARRLEGMTGNQGRLKQHIAEYGKLLPHVYFGEEINEPLFSMLQTNLQRGAIGQLVRFIEKMWFCGDEAVQNVVVVTILERLGDERAVWHNLEGYVTEDFRRAVNEFGVENLYGRTFDGRHGAFLGDFER